VPGLNPPTALVKTSPIYFPVMRRPDSVSLSRWVLIDAPGSGRIEKIERDAVRVERRRRGVVTILRRLRHGGARTHEQDDQAVPEQAPK
jgi:hypothetical protein